jgi:hypothetical protein
MKAVRKPVIVGVEEFWPEIQPWPDNVLATDKGIYLLWNPTRGTYSPIQPGDYVIDGYDPHAVRPDVFFATYDIIEP